ncbi:MAG: UDP-2,3-diacylglucosamine pyrophosphatase [Rhodospirillales bacterium 20-60-12]|nr:MAG: UDP-2,3-diacylglucosamine pyrophosphatase [Rhodospirillales bacterium 20-60-12]HQT68340.1 UDP-2,3-diacylglucosamine diphosphatase LpxI [Acetobacteraceae bacterium]
MADQDAAPLGIIAGGGALPGLVAAAARASGRPVFIIGLEGFAEPAILAPFPHEMFRFGAAGRMIAALRAHGCRDLVMVGPVKRPSLLNIRPDAEAARLLARVGRAAFAGDDGLLAAIVRVLGDEGFRVHGAHEILTNVIGAGGLLAGSEPDDLASADIARGVAVLHALGTADVGQACVVQQGIVLAVEAAEGTDGMLSRVASLARPGPGGVLVKLVKSIQDRRTDLPTIGAATIRNAALAGLRGVAFEANGTIIMDREAAIAAAQEAGLFLIGINPA